MNLENKKIELQSQLQSVTDKLDLKFQNILHTCGVESSIYSYTIKQDFESDDFKLKIIRDDFNVTVDIEDIKSNESEISISLEVPRHWSMDFNLMDEKSYAETKTHFEKSQEIFDFGSYIKDNIDSLKPYFVELFTLQNGALDLKYQISQNNQNIKNNIDEILLNDVIEHLQISDENTAKDLFKELDFEYDSTVNLITVESVRNSSNQLFIKFDKDVLDIENSGRLNCKYNGSRIAKKDIERRLKNRILFDGDFDKNFESIQKLLGIPEPSHDQSSIHIACDDFYELLENQKKKNDVLEFVENKKANLVKSMFDIDPFSKNKKKMGLFGPR